MKLISSILVALTLLMASQWASAASNAGLGDHKTLVNDPLFFAQELLGRPTDTTITINAGAIKKLEGYYEYGTSSGVYTNKSSPVTFIPNEPVNVLIEKLKPNTQYFYRLRYRELGAAEYVARTERTFHTARPPGSAFTFVAQFDPHLDENTSEDAYKLTLKNMLADKPDFLIDVGDNSFVEKLRPATKAGVEDRLQLIRSYYDFLTHSAALFMAVGNHEGEWGKYLNGTPNNVAVWNTLARKQYVPNPEPNAFYTGSNRQEPFVGLRQANYAWNWGDALFIVLDPYWNQPVAPELGGDWFLTLGKEQYDWLKKTLETSKAKYKFVFAHNLIGGANMNGLMRGGIAAVKNLEWGGYNLDGTWGFDTARPGWGKPIHQLLIDNKATIFFHGHDHLYAKEDMDGIVYQEGPMPGSKNASTQARNPYKYTGTVVGGTGYLRVRVSPEDVKVDFVQTWLPEQENAKLKNGMLGDSYTIKARK
jgi:hypothetical protein